MSYNPELAKNSIESSKNVSRHKVEPFTFMLPKDMRPSQEAFESLGFKFNDIGNDILYLATLPDGWTTKSYGEFSTYLIDEKGRKRGCWFYNEDLFEDKAYMYLMPRFHVKFKVIEPDDFYSPISVYVKDADGTIIFYSGHYTEHNKEDVCRLHNSAIEYLQVNFPEWKDPMKYWD